MGSTINYESDGLKSSPSNINRVIVRNIVRVGLPVALQSMLVALLSLTDVVMVSSYGTESAAAVGLASKWHFLIIMIMSGISQAAGILIAQFSGKSDFKSAKSIFNKSLFSGLTIFTIPVILMTFMPSYFILCQTDDKNVIDQGSTYLVWSSLVQLLTFFVILCESSMRSTGDGFTPLVIGTITILLNIFFNYCFIGGNFGFSPMEVKGAAVATTLARVIQFVILIGFFVVKGHWIYKSISNPLPSTVVSRLKRLSVSCTASSVVFAVGAMISQILVGKIGTIELATYCILVPFFNLMYALYYGLSVASSVTIGGLLGKKDFTGAKATAKSFLKWIGILGLITGVLLYLLKPVIIQCLNFNDNQLALASYALNVASIYCVLCMLNMMLVNGILRAGGQNSYTLYCNIFTTWCCDLPFTAIAVYLGSSFYTAYPFLYSGEILGFILLFIGYTKGRWLADLTV